MATKTCCDRCDEATTRPDGWMKVRLSKLGGALDATDVQRELCQRCADQILAVINDRPAKPKGTR